MLRIDRDSQTLEPILPQTLTEAGIKETAGLQVLIERNSKAFFDEIGLGNAILLGKEIPPASEIVGDRIDLLALDEEGTAIIIELKRESNKLGNKLHLLQGISYAAMIAKWQTDQFTELLRDRDFELGEGAKINSAQKVVLIADAFEYEVLATAEWLMSNYGLDILCIRLEVAKDPASCAEYLTCEQVYPPLEVEEQVRRRKRSKSVPPDGSIEAPKAITNPDLSAFVDEQRTKVSFDEKNKALKYVVGGKVAWSVAIHRRFASVWQYRRFSGDLDFWKRRLSNPDAVGEKDNGHALAFRLESKSDFDAFLDALSGASTFDWQSKSRGRDGA